MEETVDLLGPKQRGRKEQSTKIHSGSGIKKFTVSQPQISRCTQKDE